jgi:hypothetical protein
VRQESNSRDVPLASQYHDVRMPILCSLVRNDPPDMCASAHREITEQLLVWIRADYVNQKQRAWGHPRKANVRSASQCQHYDCPFPRRRKISTSMTFALPMRQVPGALKEANGPGSDCQAAPPTANPGSVSTTAHRRHMTRFAGCEYILPTDTQNRWKFE